MTLPRQLRRRFVIPCVLIAICFIYQQVKIIPMLRHFHIRIQTLTFDNETFFRAETAANDFGVSAKNATISENGRINGSSGNKGSMVDMTSENNGTERFHVIVTFRLIKSLEPKASLRMKEYIDCLKSFLNNSNVKQVHLMHNSPEMPGYIQVKVGAHPKLSLHRVDYPDVVLTLHQFAFTHLQGEVVLITQADIILGEGFQKVNRTLLMENNLFYSLSRHERECFTQPNYCMKYVGSHDTFIFVPKGSIPLQGRTYLSHLIYSMGTENVVMFVYLHILKYRVLNPCWVIKVYHHHCSGYRKYTTKQIRVNHKVSHSSIPVGKLI